MRAKITRAGGAPGLARPNGWSNSTYASLPVMTFSAGPRFDVQIRAKGANLTRLPPSVRA
jgi:hypothetical protein